MTDPWDVIMYCPQHDAYLDKEADVWVDGICEDEECDMCWNRPEKPSQCDHAPFEHF